MLKTLPKWVEKLKNLFLEIIGDVEMPHNVFRDIQSLRMFFQVRCRVEKPFAMRILMIHHFLLDFLEECDNIRVDHAQKHTHTILRNYK